MNPISTADLLVHMILKGLSSIQAMVALQSKARAEGRDITAEELAGLRAVDDRVKADLDAAIKAHGGN
jgi:aryl carrier-like protein